MKKLTLKDDNSTTITEVLNEEISISCKYYHPTYTCQINNEHFTLVYTGKENPIKQCEKDFRRLVRFGFYKKFEVYIGEQEKAHWEAVAQDMQDPKQHGRLSHSILSDSGNGGCFYWDYYQQKNVRKEELTVVE